MMFQFKILLLALILQRVHSNFEIEIDSTTIYESCNDPVETASESNCYCYSEPEVDFEYSICVATNDTTTTSNNCPVDANDIYETYRLIQGKCFYFEWKHKIFKDAKENCIQKGGKLYEPTDVVMMKKVAKISAIGGHAWAWIGITDTAKEGNYVYESNGQSIKFSPPWAPLGYGARLSAGIFFNCIGLQVNGNSNRGTLADLKCHAYHSMYSICEL